MVLTLDTVPVSEFTSDLRIHMLSNAFDIRFLSNLFMNQYNLPFGVFFGHAAVLVSDWFALFFDSVSLRFEYGI